MRTPSRLVLASAAWLLLPVAGAPRDRSASPLDSPRLLPPVLLKGEEGWSLAERMRRHRVEAVSVALIRDFRATPRERPSPPSPRSWTARHPRTRRRCGWISCRGRGGATRAGATRSEASPGEGWGRQELQAALIVLQVNTSLYPDSANTWDSLGEVLLRDGQRARALECYRKVIELLPRDEKVDEAAKGQLRAHAERQIRELSAEPSSRR